MHSLYYKSQGKLYIFCLWISLKIGNENFQACWLCLSSSHSTNRLARAFKPFKSLLECALWWPVLGSGHETRSLVLVRNLSVCSAIEATSGTQLKRSGLRKTTICTTIHDLCHSVSFLFYILFHYDCKCRLQKHRRSLRAMEKIEPSNQCCTKSAVSSVQHFQSTVFLFFQVSRRERRCGTDIDIQGITIIWTHVGLTCLVVGLPKVAVSYSWGDWAHHQRGITLQPTFR